MLLSRIQKQASLDEIHTTLVRLPFFEGVQFGSIELEQLGGALTNASYRITTEQSGAYVLRLAGQGTSDYIDRTSEGHNARFAAACGINVEVLHFDERDGTMLTRFIEGTTMGEESFILDPNAPARAALALKGVHNMGSVFWSRFDAFAKIDGYLQLLHNLETPLAEACYEAVEYEEAQAMRRVLQLSPAPLVPCHNDPWPGNLLDAGGRVYLIDWEYSGMNDPMWDLADLSVEAGFGPEQDRIMMDAYCGGTAPPALYSRLEVQKAMSDLHWSLWGFVQHAEGNQAEDFRSYGLGRLGRSYTRMSSPDFGRNVWAVRTGGLQPHHPYPDAPARPAAALAKVQ